MSQTDPKSKPSSTPSTQKTGKRPAGGSPGLVYVVVFLILAVVVAAYLIDKGSDETRPVASADVEEASSVESEAVAEGEGESDSVSLVIDSNVRGADVFLNGNRVGKTPHKATPLTPGDYDVTVAHEGYETFEKNVHVETPQDAIHATLRPTSGESHAPKADAADAEEGAPEAMDIRANGESVAVKHNHRIGSCEGTLVASTDGIRFETEHKDAFFAAYAEIEELSLEDDKLILKVLNGRKYDFKEQDGDADALAAFHAQAANR